MPVVFGAPNPGGPPHAVAVVEPPVEELIVLNYRMALTCFATIDVITTFLNNISTFASGDGEHAYQRLLFGLFGLVFLIGPICGIIGARRLNRSLVSVYLAFCIVKTCFEVASAIVTLFLWFILLALLQLWITKIVATFWRALGAIPPERRMQLANEKEATARMVYW